MRDLRDILAECMRIERLGDVAPAWNSMHDRHCAADMREPMRFRADDLMRLLAERGVRLVRHGEPAAHSVPAGPVIWRGVLADKDDGRAIMKGPGADWLITSFIAGEEKTEQSFTLAQAAVNAGRILIDDPEVRKVPGVMKQIAAANEVYRVHAAAMEAPDA